MPVEDAGLVSICIFKGAVVSANFIELDYNQFNPTAPGTGGIAVNVWFHGALGHLCYVNMDVFCIDRNTRISTKRS